MERTSKITKKLIKEATKIVDNQDLLNIDEFLRAKQIDNQLEKEIFITKISKSGKYYFEIMPESNTWYIKKKPVHWREWVILISLIITAIATAGLLIYPLLIELLQRYK